MHFIAFSAKQITWSGPSERKEYESSPNIYRGFCQSCGSPLYWRAPNESPVEREFEVPVGTLDQEFLVGKDAWGKELSDPVGGRFYSENEISGLVHESSSGKRYQQGSGSRALESGQ